MESKNLNYKKYLKYKNKYLNLMNQINGGGEEYIIKKNKDNDITIIDNISKINNTTFHDQKVTKLVDVYCEVLATLLLNNLINEAITFYTTIVLLDSEIAAKVDAEIDSLEEKQVLKDFKVGVQKFKNKQINN